MRELALLIGDGADEPQDQTSDPTQGDPLALKVSQFKTFLQDCRWQPPWRTMADKAVDYYDSNQLDLETLEALNRKGMGPLIRNITAPIINVVLGMEAKTRTDWRVSADTDDLQEVAEALSAKLHEAERETHANRACADAYAGEIKAGIGWVEVSPTSDPFDYPHRAESVHRREIWWDWRDMSPALMKARYLIRKRWYDVDQAVAYFPEHEEVLRATVGDPTRFELVMARHSLDLAQTLEVDRGLDIEDLEQWRSFDRHRLCLYEVWYRVFKRGWTAKLPNGRVVEIDTKNPAQLALLNRGLIKPQRGVYSKLRMSIWAGPIKLYDCASDRHYFPYVPFWGYREDRTGVPYGLIRAMISPQDEVNARLQKMMWLLGAKRVRMDSDALDTTMQSPQDMLDELSRPDAVVFQNPKRTNQTGSIEIEDNLQLADAQFKVLQDAMQSAQQVVGVFNATLGRDSSTTANSAIQSLVEQGTTALAEINDNYRYARRTVGERLLDRVREDLIGHEVEVMAGEPGRRRKIVLNKGASQRQQMLQRQAQMQQSRIADPNEAQPIAQIENNVEQATVKVALDDVPSSPSYRQEQFTMLAELTKGLPPNIQSLVVPFVLEASDLSKRREMADTIRKALGMPTPKTPDEEEQQAQAQAQAAQFAQEIQQKTALLELQEREAKIAQLRATAQKTLAEAQSNPHMEANLRAEFEQRVVKAEAQAKVEIDRVTAEMMTVRMNASTREQKLIAQMAALAAIAKTNANATEVEKRKAEIELEVAKIGKEKDIEVARIEGESAKIVEGLTAEMAKLREDLLARIEQARKDADAKVEAAKKDADKAAADAKKESERQRKEDSAKPQAQAAAPSAPVTVVVGGGDTEIEIKKQPDGSYKGVKRSTKKKP